MRTRCEHAGQQQGPALSATKAHGLAVPLLPPVLPAPLVALMIASPSLPAGRTAGLPTALMADVDFVARDVAAVAGAVAAPDWYGVVFRTRVSGPEPSVVYADISPP